MHMHHAHAQVLFVFCCPDDAPVRGKMLHASSKAHMLEGTLTLTPDPDPPTQTQTQTPTPTQPQTQTQTRPNPCPNS